MIVRQTKLVDGVVTDDSDVFLFGGTHIYKNIFDNQKYVESYHMSDVERDLGLDREKLVLMVCTLLYCINHTDKHNITDVRSHQGRG